MSSTSKSTNQWWHLPLTEAIPRKKTAKRKKPLVTLAVNLIPAGNWNKNVRAVVAQDIWESMRYCFRATKTQPNFMRRLDLPSPDVLLPLTCATCGEEKESLELHECWDYDDKSLVQKLVSLIPICDKCHNVVHFGRASQLGLAEEAFRQLCKINKLTEDEGRQQVDAAYAIWMKRSQNGYALNFDKLHEFMPDSLIHLDWLEQPKFWSGNRLEAIAWARDRLASKEVVIVDTETTGLISGLHKNERAEVIELAIVSMKGKVLYSSRFRPKYKIPKRTTEIHGINNDDVKDCPTFAEEQPKILAALAGKLALSYNDRFDSGVIGKTCAMYKMSPPDCKWECVMRMYRAFIEGPRFVRLPGTTHGAVEDCRATLRLVRLMAKG